MKTFKLENLSCAHCATEIEDALRATSGVRAAHVQFATLDLRVDADDLDEVKRVIHSVEPDVRVLEPDAAPTEETPNREWVPLAAASAVLASLLVGESFWGWEGWIPTAVTAVLYALSGWPVWKKSYLNVREGRWFDENFLMAFATLAAWLVGAGLEAASVMLFYQWGEYFQDRAVERSRRSLGALLASRPRSARVVEKGVVTERSPDAVAAGTEIEVRPGEQVPLDGEVLSGTGTIDTAALTGESLPRPVEPGLEVAAGSVNLDAVLRLRVVRPFAQSAWAGIVDSVDEALSRKAPLDQFLTRFARQYTPAVLCLALILFASLSAAGLPWHDSLYRALVLLVISCPCALVVSVPLTYLGAIGAASRRGLIVRDAGALDRLATVNAAAFDKTGTLTEGRPTLKRLTATGDEQTLQAVLDAGFAASTHPLAKAWGGTALAPADAVETRGQGVLFTFQGQPAGIGRRSFLARRFGFDAGDDEATAVHAFAGLYLGHAEFEDAPKADTPKALEELKALGIAPVALLSGDTPQVVERFGAEWGVEARGGLLPQEKLAFVEAWENQGRRVLFAGDGMNDAPVLARASVGVSVGAGASAAAMETADVVLLEGSPRQVARLIRLGRRTKTLLVQNIVFALAVKAGFMVLGGFGLAGLWEAVFADVGVALLAVLNALRAGR